LYRETDLDRLPPVLAQLATHWNYNPIGIGMVGTSGAGKTRTAVVIATRMCDEGRSVFYVTATDYAAAAANQWADEARDRNISTDTLRQARKAQVLILDDLGKNRMTDRAEATLYELLEARTSHRLPTIWTSNARAKELHAMFSPDRADAMLRRLGSDFNRVVKV
jgi:DNA replication protein DnaC